MGNFNFDMQLGMKQKVNGKCSDCVSEGVVLDFPMVVDCEFGLIG